MKKIKFSKKGALGIVMMLFLALVAFLILFTFVGRFLKVADEGLQSEICRANIALLNSEIKEKSDENSGIIASTWNLVKDNNARAMLKNPLCTSLVEVFDYRDVKDKNQLRKKVATDIGEMMQNCWKTFGEGKQGNTFGQEKGWAGRGDKNNYYFSCYKFKFKMKDSSDSISMEYLNGDKGLLWKYNVDGKPLFNENGRLLENNKLKDEDKMIEATIKQSSLMMLYEEYYNNPSSDKIPYLGYITWDGYGYYEFVKKTASGLKIDSAGENVAKGAISGTTAGVIGAVIGTGLCFYLGPGAVGCAALGSAIAGGAAAGGASLASKGLIDSFQNKNVPVMADEYKLKEIYSDQYYEVRYYSPYIKNIDEESWVLNNIKIVPINEESKDNKEIPGGIS
ncbi:MAG: hypothetical protein ACQER9_00060 [Nanobdellota archaeon]